MSVLRLTIYLQKMNWHMSVWIANLRYYRLYTYLFAGECSEHARELMLLKKTMPQLRSFQTNLICKHYTNTSLRANLGRSYSYNSSIVIHKSQIIAAVYMICIFAKIFPCYVFCPFPYLLFLHFYVFIYIFAAFVILKKSNKNRTYPNRREEYYRLAYL